MPKTKPAPAIDPNSIEYKRSQVERLEKAFPAMLRELAKAWQDYGKDHKPETAGLIIGTHGVYLELSADYSRLKQEIFEAEKPQQ